MDSTMSTMLWNFEEGLGSESDSLGTSSVGSDADTLSLLLASMARPMTQPISGLSALSGAIGLPPSPPTIKDQVVKCPICMESFRQPKVLACFHSFCKNCLERQLLETNENRIVCPQCHVETQLSAQLGIDGLLSDYGLENAVRRRAAEAKSNASSDEKGLIFGSPSSTSSSSSPPIGDLCSSEQDGAAQAATQSAPNTCTGCKSGEAATAYCTDCQHHLCGNCTMAHRFMHCFEGHRVEELSGTPSSVSTDDSGKGSSKDGSSHCKCLEHRSQPLRFFCLTCNLAICRDCTVSEHVAPAHNVEAIDNVAEKQIGLMEALINEARAKQAELHEIFRLIDADQSRLNASFQQAQNNVDESANILIQLVQETRKGLSKELETLFGYKQLQLTIIDKEVQKMTKKMAQTIEFTQRLLKYSSPTEVMVFKPLLDSRLQGFLNFNADANNLLHTSCEIDTRPLDVNQARQAVLSLMNTMQSDSWPPMPQNAQRNSSSPPQMHFPYNGGVIPPIGRPPSSRQVRSPPAGSYSQHNGLPSSFTDGSNSLLNVKNDLFDGGGNATTMGIPIMHHHLDTGLGHMGAIGASAPAGSSLAQHMAAAAAGEHNSSNSQLNTGSNSIFNQYEKWSSGLDPAALGALSLNDPDTITDLSILANSTDKLNNAAGVFPPYPPRSQIKRQKMTYHCKFGEFGVMEGQFTEPSGVVVNAQNDIIVADTNNHRIQVFDKEGRFKFQFGECGKRDGQLLYPNRVSVNRVTGDFIVTERSPTHQIQIYNQYGQFLRKFGANILQHPRGVCVDKEGRIIVVECKVMRVLIFDAYGNVIQKFSCSRYLEFPNGVCTNDKNEILISDNRAHCIKVFNYEGHYVRQIGGEGITNYPIGVGINSAGEVVVADNHNNFNLTIFSQDGTLVNALESKVKHAQCFDVALVDDGSVVLASKDYRLYLYRYQQPPNSQQNGLSMNGLQ
ncbi:NHL repeat domain-containing protein [Ditylenchus destructor]|nr:NHL repeat domain-containing protein [Ditylenchus destructor]